MEALGGDRVEPPVEEDEPASPRYCAEGCGDLAPLAPWCEHEWEALVEGGATADDHEADPWQLADGDHDLGGEA